MESDEHPAGDPRADGGPPPRPAWVRWLVAALVIVVLILVAVMVLAGGEHGPGRHSS